MNPGGRWLAALALASLWFLVSAHVVTTFNLEGTLTEARWDHKRVIPVSLWDGFTSTLPEIAEGTAVGASVQAALEAWVSVSELTATLRPTARRTLGSGPDGLNLVTLPAAGSDDATLLPPGVLATTVLEIDGQGKITEADVLFAPDVEGGWGTDESGGATNLLSVARHEFGHFFNLGHSVHLDATMYFRSGNFPHAFNRLSWDDIAGLNRVDGGNGYRMLGLGQITGSIAGRVGRGGEDIFGAVVVACDADGLSVASAISRTDGRYSLQNLPPGSYTLYVQPLSGPTTPFDVSGGIFDSLPAADFQPEFYLGSAAPNVEVSAGSTTSDVDFEIGVAVPSLMPSQVGAQVDISGGFTTSSFPARATAGSETNVIVAGAGFGSVNGLTLLGPHVEQTAFLGNVMLGDGLTPAALLKVSTGESPQGAYPLLPRTVTELTAITGGLQIVGPLRFRSAFAQFIDFPDLGGARVFLLNPALEGTDAAGLLEIRDGAGAISEIEIGDGNALSLPPGASAILESHSDEAFVGSLRALADAPLTGAVLFDTAVGVTGAGVSEPAYRFVMPLVIADAGKSIDTGLALTNLGDQPATFFLQAHGRNGQAAAALTDTLPAGGHASSFVRELLPQLPDNFEGTALVTSNRPLGAVAIRTEPGLFTTFPVVQSHVLTTLNFAHFVHVPQLFSSEVILFNPSSVLTAKDVVVEFRDPDGATRPLTFNGSTAPDGLFQVGEIPPLGCVTLRGGGSLQLIGSLKVSGNLPLGGAVLFASEDFGTTGVGASRATDSLAAVIVQDLPKTVRTGFAVSNLNTTPVDLEISARDMAGQPAGVAVTVSLSADGHLARFIDEDLDGKGGRLQLPAQFQGSLWIRAVDGEGRVTATNLRQTLNPGVLTTLPAAATRPPIVPVR